MTRKISSPSHLVGNCQNKWRTHSLPRSQRRHFICSLINLPQLDNPSCLGTKIIGIFPMNSFSLPHSRSIHRLSSFISRRGFEQKQSISFSVLSDEIIALLLCSLRLVSFQQKDDRRRKIWMLQVQSPLMKPDSLHQM